MTANQIAMALECLLLCAAFGGGIFLWVWCLSQLGGGGRLWK